MKYGLFYQELYMALVSQFNHSWLNCTLIPFSRLFNFRAKKTRENKGLETGYFLAQEPARNLKVRESEKNLKHIFFFFFAFYIISHK